METVCNMQTFHVLLTFSHLFFLNVYRYITEEPQISFYCTRIDALALPKLVVTDDLDSLTKYFNQQKSYFKKKV